MTREANLAASVAARLLNRARATGEDHQTLLTGYCFERFLYRLGVSAVRTRFVLKGAMLLRIWSENPYRATRDLDLLRRGDGSLDATIEKHLFNEWGHRRIRSQTFFADRGAQVGILSQDLYRCVKLLLARQGLATRF